MNVVVNTDNLRARIAAAAPRMKKAAEEVAFQFDREIAEAAIVDMPEGGNPRTKNTTPFLRMQTHRLQRSLSEFNNQYHVFQLKWSGEERLQMITGTAAASDKGFPYALYHEQHGRPFLSRAAAEVGSKENIARRLADALVKVLNETK